MCIAWTTSSTESLTYPEFISITLTALAVILATLGVIVAMLAGWGYRAIKTDSRNFASKAAREAVKEFFDDAHISGQLEEMVKRRVSEEGDQLYQDLSLTGGAKGDLVQPQEHDEAAGGDGK